MLAPRMLAPLFAAVRALFRPEPPLMSPGVRAALSNPATRHLVLEAYLRRRRPPRR